MKNASDKFVDKSNTHFVFNYIFPKILSFMR